MIVHFSFKFHRNSNFYLTISIILINWKFISICNLSFQVLTGLKDLLHFDNNTLTNCEDLGGSHLNSV